MLRNAKIGVKLTGGFALIALLGAMTGILGIVMVNRVGKSADVIYKEGLPIMTAAVRIQHTLETQHILLHDLVFVAGALVRIGDAVA